MKILITGAGKNAFLGYHVKKLFLEYFSNDDVCAVGSEFDLTHEPTTFGLFDWFRPNIVIHLAALAGGIGLNMKRPADLTRVNLQMSLNVLQACNKYNIDYLVGLGSVCGFPMYCQVPFNENDYFGAMPELTNGGYGYSKRVLCLLQNTYRKQYNLKSIHLVPANLFGPKDHFDLENSHVIPALINKFINAVKNNKSVVQCWGTGQATREFLYAPDLAECILQAAILQPNEELPINVGTGQDISIKELAQLIAKLVKFTGKIEFTGEISDGQPKRRLDVQRAKDILEFTATTSLEIGLKETIEWYKNNAKS